MKDIPIELKDKLKIIASVRANYRYETFKATYEGQPAFFKRALSSKSERRLKKQVSSTTWTNRLGKTCTEAPLRAPRTLASGIGYLITEWIDGSDLDKNVKTDPVFTAKLFSYWLEAYDQWGNYPWSSYKASFWMHDSKDRTVYSIRKNLKKAVLRGEIPQGLIDKSLVKFEELFSLLEARFQDADIKPQHIFKDPELEGGYILIDSEYSRRTWPRFYDLGNLLSKYWVVYDDHSFPNKLLSSFLDQTEVEEEKIVNALRAICIVRGLSFHNEFEADSSKDNVNTRANAQKLLAFSNHPSKLADWLKY